MADDHKIERSADRIVVSKEVTIIARPRASEFEEPVGDADRVDEEADKNTVRAYRSILQYLRLLSQSRPQLTWQHARPHVRPFLRQISRKYWADYDYDNRARSVDVKQEARSLIAPLKRTIRLLEEVSDSARKGINLQAKLLLSDDNGKIEDVHKLACVTNEALLNACQLYVKKIHKKKGDVRFKNATVALMKMCESVMGRNFRGGRPMARAADQKRARGIKREFVGDSDAQFIFVALNGIDRGVKPAHVETALKEILGK